MNPTKKINLDDPDIKQRAIYNNGGLAIIDNLCDIAVEEVVNENTYIFLLCLTGKASVYMNEQTYGIQKNDLFVCLPDIILENALLSMDFKCYCLCMSSEYAQQVAPNTNLIWNYQMFFKRTPLLSLTPDDASLFCQYYELIRSKLTTASNVHLAEVVNALLQAFIYEFLDAMNHFIQITPSSFSSGENLFKSFISLLTSSYPKQRSVAYYAQQLHVTPKYLSSVCKEISGQSTSRLIDQYVVKDIEYLLKRTQKSIKEISNELDFPDISFFGKYVKKHFGTSPRALREQFAK